MGPRLGANRWIVNGSGPFDMNFCRDAVQVELTNASWRGSLSNRLPNGRQAHGQF